MGKYAKFALVLLYAAQLVIAFREQLVHLYKEAVESVHRESAFFHEKEPDDGVRLKRSTTPRFSPHEILVAAHHIPATLSVAFGGHGSHDSEHPVHDDDRHKDKAKKHRQPRPFEYLIRNLFPDMRRIVASAAAPDDGRCAERMTLYPQGAAHIV